MDSSRRSIAAPTASASLLPLAAGTSARRVAVHEPGAAGMAGARAGGAASATPDNCRVMSAIGSAERHGPAVLDTPRACHDSGLFHDTPRSPSSRMLAACAATGAALTAGLDPTGGAG